MTGKQGTKSHDNLDRRSFLKHGGGLGLTLGLGHLGTAVSPGFVSAVLAGEQAVSYNSWEDIYRNEWKWDGVTWGSHTNQCAPGGCSFRVYTKNGVVWREEQSARSYASNPDYPDFNPQGCQKGCGFHHVLMSPERVKYPLKRVGERGAGQWERISWDQALGEVADSILDAHENHGPETVIMDSPHIHAGSVAVSAINRLQTTICGLETDLNVTIGDDLKGIGHTFGKMNIGYTADNLFDAELIILTHSNVSYTWSSSYHFLTEARYNGSEVVLIAPDYNATGLTADVHLPVKVASDAALWMAVCQVMIEEGIYQPDFVRTQTDLAFLVRKDNGHYLNAADVEGGRKDQYYFFDETTGEITEAPRDTLEYDGVQALEGSYKATLDDGSEVEVATAFSLLKEKVDKDYRPEQASEVCGIHADVIRQLARKVATKRTCSYIGFTSAKHFHGDLMERAILMAMGLSGNWGKPGTGTNCFLIPDTGIGAVALLDRPMDDWGLEFLKAPLFFDAMVEKLKDTDKTQELIGADIAVEMTAKHGKVAPAFFMYNHAGYHKLWDNPDWQDPTLGRPFGQYLKESIKKKYWNSNQIKPTPDQVPQVLFFMANNPLRRQRSGRQMYVEELFPKTKQTVAIETRMSSTAAFCDIVLPAAWYYEKEDMTMTFGLNPYTALIERAVQPPGEAKPEWEIFNALAAKITERAAARGMTSYENNAGEAQYYADVHNRFTMDGHLETQEDALREMVKVAEAIGSFPKGFTYEKFKELGQVKVAGYGSSGPASDTDPTKPFYSLAYHVDKNQIYPTQSRRAQFYIDHEWFIEADEAFPTHKDTPPIGGMYPFRLVSGHSRNSIHSLQTATPFFLRLHRAQPIVFINDQTAAEKDIADGDMVRIFNDYDNAEFMAALSPAAGPDQVVVYMWENYQFKEWKSHDNMLIGMPKGTHMAGDYAQLRFKSLAGSASPANDRGLRVGLTKIDGADA